MGQGGAGRPDRAAHGGGRSAFVGRSEQLAALRDAFARSAAGTQIVWVVGESGIGKTTLVRRSLEPGDRQVIWVAADEAETSVPFGVVAQLHVALRGVLAVDSVAPSLDLAADPISVGAGLLSALGMADQPVVVVVDDLQWADAPSAAALHFALRRLANEPITVVLISRPDLGAELGQSWERSMRDTGRVRQVAVDGLDVGELIDLSDRVGAARIDREAAARLFEHTRGHPLYTRLLLEELSSVELHDPATVLPAPRSLAAIAVARVAAAPPAARALGRASAPSSCRPRSGSWPKRSTGWGGGTTLLCTRSSRCGQRRRCGRARHPVKAAVPVTPGEQLQVVTGCAGGGMGGQFTVDTPGAGYGSGGTGGGRRGASSLFSKYLPANLGGGGGGGSAVLRSDGTPLVVAGGGGGGGGAGTSQDGAAGGAGGQAGSSASGAGGAAGAAPTAAGADGSDTASCAGAGGGGGGGAHGGLGGNAGSCLKGGGGGGGGSSLVAAGVSGRASEPGGGPAGNGVVLIAAVGATAPSAPQSVTASVLSHVVRLDFAPPADDGGTPVDSYTATVEPGGQTVSAAHSPIIFSGLDNGTSYSFTIQAHNDAGLGSPSAPVSATPSAAAGPPGSVTAIAGDGQAIVAFQPPLDDGGAPVTSYRVISNPGGTVATGTRSPITVGGLTNGTSYTFAVMAVNRWGAGALSEPSAPVTPTGAASAPAITSIVPSNRQLLVSFDAPTADGGSPVVAYRLVASPGGRVAQGTGSPIGLSGLQNGTAYTVQVMAITSRGLGVASAPVVATPANIPSPPFFPTARAGEGSATVSFTAPLSDGGAPITSYTVTAIPGGATATGSQSPITVTGLTPGVAYRFSVVATNITGDSQPATTVQAVTPTAPTRPSNDAFASAVAISGDSGSVSGTNVNATKEAGEPDHDDNAGGASVWYRYTFTHGGSVVFDTCGSGFDTLVGVYRGDGTSTVDTLGPQAAFIGVAGCADGSNATQATIDLPASGGVLFIAVDGVNGGAGPATGAFTVNWHPGSGGG